MRTRISHETSGSFSCCCCSPPSPVVACPLGRPRLGLASRRPDLVVVLAGRSFLCTVFSLVLLVARRSGFSSGVPTAGLGLSAPLPCGRVGWPPFPLSVLSLGVGLSLRAFTAGLGLSAPLPCGRVGWPPFPLGFLSCIAFPLCFFQVSSCRAPTNLHSLTAALCQFARRAEGINTVSGRVQDVLASAVFSAAATVQAPLLSATVVAMGARSRSPTPLPKRAPHARELSGPLLGVVSSLASMCCPPLTLSPCGSLAPRLQLTLQPVVLVVVARGLEPATSPNPSPLRSPLSPSKAAPLASLLSLRTEIGFRKYAGK